MISDKDFTQKIWHTQTNWSKRFGTHVFILFQTEYYSISSSHSTFYYHITMIYVSNLILKRLWISNLKIVPNVTHHRMSHIPVPYKCVRWNCRWTILIGQCPSCNAGRSSYEALYSWHRGGTTSRKEHRPESSKGNAQINSITYPCFYSRNPYHSNEIKINP